MDQNHLSKRLATVGNYVSEGGRLADIGSDHAYLPIHLMLNGKITYAIAGEVVEGPFESTRNKIKALNLEEKIAARFANGLAAIKQNDQITDITIAGMGGALIAQILEEGKVYLTHQERLILQPNVGEILVREWLQKNKYQIIEESLVSEKDKRYEVIVAESNNKVVSYNRMELLMGPLLLKEKGQNFRMKWKDEILKRKHVIRDLQKAREVDELKIEKLNNEILKIQEVLAND